jgi:exonuclease SbcC
LAATRSRLAVLTEQQSRREALQARHQALSEELAGLRVRNTQMRAEMEGLRAKLDILEGESGEAACPLCGQPLSGQHREELWQQFEAEGTALRDAHRANTARGKEIEAETHGLQDEARQLDRELAELGPQQRREAQLEQAVAEAERAAAARDASGGELAALRTRLDGGDFAREEQAALQALAAQRQELGYDSQAHKAASARLESLRTFEEEHRHLQTALERVDVERAALADLHARHQRWQKTRDEDQSRRQGLAVEVARLPEVSDRLEASTREVDDLQARSSRARQELGAAQQKLDHCRYLSQERTRRVADRERLVEEKALLDELRLAFGKKGIQAMIIEAAIPEIEYEANRLLARMTDSRMHVRFETQRETLKGDTLEPLDINISDELGTRPYDSFSGGEAFRVNFAIRIALSKLLAHRAGAQLQMLVIDEGFGTQDAEGRARLVEAINSIQDDFSRILVITHIEELKDAFPVRIEVVKTASGSQISLN